MALDVKIQTVGKDAAIDAIRDIKREEAERLEQFKKINNEYDSQNQKLKSLQSHLVELKKAKNEAFDPEKIKEYEKEIEQTQKEVDSLTKSLKGAGKATDDLASKATEVKKEFEKLSNTVDAALNNAPSKKITNELKNIAQEVENTRKEVKKLEVTQDDVFTPEEVKKYEAEIEHARQEVTRLNAELRRANVVTDDLGDEAGQAQKKFQNFGKVVKTALLGAFIQKFAGGLVDIGKKVVETKAKFEAFEATLTIALGSKSNAQNALELIKEFAASTPFQVDELTGSFVKLANRGFVPLKKELTQLGDLAASQGKSFDQLTEALLDAQTGEFERLKEFGIKAKKAGDQVTFSFKGVTKTVRNSEKAIRDAILGFGSLDGVAGSTAAVSRTLAGQLSNLQDKITALFLALGDRLGPAIKTVLSGLGGLVDLTKDFVSSATPAADAVQREKDELNLLVSTIKDSNTSNEARKVLIEELNQKYPEFTKQVDISKASEEDLKKVLAATNKEYDKRIVILATRDVRKNFLKEQAESIKAEAQQLKLLKQLRKGTFANTFGNEVAVDGSAQKTAIQQSELIIKQIRERRKKLAKEFQADLKEFNNIAKKLGVDLNKEVAKSGKITVKGTKKTTKQLSKEQLKRIQGQQKKQFEFNKRVLKAQQEAEKLSIESQIKFNQEILKNENTTLSERKQALNEIAMLESEQAKLKLKNTKALDDLIAKSGVKSIQNSKSISEERANIETVQNSQLVKIRQKLVDDLKKLDDQYFTDLEARLQNETQQAITKLDVAQNRQNIFTGADESQQITTLNKRFLKELKAAKGNKNELIRIEKEFTAERERIQNQSAQKSVRSEIDTIRKKLEIGGLSIDEEFRLGKELLDHQKELSMLELDDFKRKEQAKVDATREGAEKRRAIVDASVELGKTLVQGAFDFQRIKQDEELQNLQVQKEAEIKAAGENSEARQAIEEKFRKKENEIKRKQAKSDKLASLFQIAIRTAENIVKVFPNPVLISLAAATGAVQAAIVARQPLPKFHSGKEAEGTGEMLSVIQRQEKVIDGSTSKNLLSNGWTNGMLTELGLSGLSPRDVFNSLHLDLANITHGVSSELKQVKSRQAWIEEKMEKLSEGFPIWIGAAQDGGWKAYTDRASQEHKTIQERRDL